MILHTHIQHHGQRVGLPVTLPGDFQAVARNGGAHLGLASLGNRLYVDAEAAVDLARAGLEDVRMAAQELKVRRETLLEQFKTTQFELATVYSVAVCATARDPALATQFAQMIAGPANRALRERAGFD